MKQFYISFEYLIEFDENKNTHYGTIMEGTKKVENLKELKQGIKDVIDWNIEENPEWFENISKQFDEVEDKVYMQKNDLNPMMFYLFERFGYKEDHGLEPIYRVQAYPITQKNAKNFLNSESLEGVW